MDMNRSSAQSKGKKSLLGSRKGNLRETVMRIVFLVAACISILCVALICIYLFANGIPAIAEIGPVEFLLGTEWRPNADMYGIVPHDFRQYLRHRRGHHRGVPLGLLAAIYMAKFCPRGCIRS